jgi:heme-degrading monooxygenase HmoA
LRITEKKMHIILWEFVVKPDKIDAFVAAYKATGDWAQLFRLADGYEGTELLSSIDSPDRFVTIDRWRSLEDFARFQQQFGEQYRTQDKQLEGLTLSEQKLGTFTTWGHRTRNT